MCGEMTKLFCSWRCNRPPPALPCYGGSSVVEITTNTRKNYLRPLLFLPPKNLQHPGSTSNFVNLLGFFSLDIHTLEMATFIGS